MGFPELTENSINGLNVFVTWYTLVWWVSWALLIFVLIGQFLASGTQNRVCRWNFLTFCIPESDLWEVVTASGYVVPIYLQSDSHFKDIQLQFHIRSHLGHINQSSPGQNGRHIAHDFCKCNFVNEKFGILIKISLNFAAQGPIDNSPALV